MTTKKPLVLVIVVVFLGFYLMQDPDGLAAVVKDAGLAVGRLASTLFEAVIEFLNALRS